MNNSIYIKKSNLDQFYTNEKIASDLYKKFSKKFSNKNFTLFFEPSAGSGSFFNLFPKDKRQGIDLDPKCIGIEKQDFFKYIAPKGQVIATIGNPPFGKNASLAVKFFNKAAEFSEVIAFIVPKTFQKKSVQDRLDLNFKLKFDYDLPKNSFLLNGNEYDVPCCFQIWERSDLKRKIKKISLENDYFEFSKQDDSNIAVRRVGGRAGKATKDINSCAVVSHYFLKVKNNNKADEIIDIINSIDFSKIVGATAGVKSLSKPELIIYFLKECKIYYE